VHAPRSLTLIEPELLMLAYRSGIFPMADSREDPEIFWIEPRLRAILPLDGFHLSHSLARTLRRGRFTVTCNRAFSQVMDECAAPRRVRLEAEDEGGSWISHRIQASYENLHFLGQAHSIEVWQTPPGEQEPRLVGGLYGVGFDRVFCGESMFSRVPDASKVALAWLVVALRRGHVSLLDCQFITPHLASMGAVEMSQKRYVKLLQAAQGMLPRAAPRNSGRTPARKPASDYSPGASAGSGAGAGASEAEPGADGAGVGGVLALPEAFGALLADAASAGLASSPGNFIAQALTHTS